MDIETQETGVESVEGQPSPESQPPAETPEGQVQQEAAPAQAEKPAPFHEHPRFKELIEQKNTLSQQLQQQQAQFAQEFQRMQAQMLEMQKAFQAPPKQKPTHDHTLERLKGIDPEFAELVQEMFQKASKTETLEQKIARFEQMQEQQQLTASQQEASTKLNSLYEQFKVPAELRTDYETAIKAAAYENPRLRVSDMEAIFKQVHEQKSKWMEDFRRKERESYLAEKKKDAAPATQTGGAPSGIPGAISSREDLKKAILNDIRRGKQQV